MEVPWAMMCFMELPFTIFFDFWHNVPGLNRTKWGKKRSKSKEYYKIAFLSIILNESCGTEREWEGSSIKVSRDTFHEAGSFEPAGWSEWLPSWRSGWLGAAAAGSSPAFSTFFSLLFLFFQFQHSSSAHELTEIFFFQSSGWFRVRPTQQK